MNLSPSFPDYYVSNFFFRRTAMSPRIVFRAFFCFLTVCDKPATGPSSAPPDVSASFTSPTGGCGNFVLYKHDSLYTRFVVVNTLYDSLPIDTAYRTFSLPADSHLISVRIDAYPFADGRQYTGCFFYCTDIIMCPLGNVTPVKWNAVSGSIHVRRGEMKQTGFFSDYSVFLDINGMTFEDSLGQKEYIGHLDFDSAAVGWLPG
jgi:hypothetical protein